MYVLANGKILRRQCLRSLLIQGLAVKSARRRQHLQLTFCNLHQRDNYSICSPLITIVIISITVIYSNYSQDRLRRNWRLQNETLNIFFTKTRYKQQGSNILRQSIHDLYISQSELNFYPNLGALQIGIKYTDKFSPVISVPITIPLCETK